MYGKLSRYFFIPALMFSAEAVSQPMMEHLVVVGGGSYGADCYEASSAALQFGVGDRDGVLSCTRALEHGDMTQSFRTAVLVNRGIIHAAMGNYELAARDYERAEEMNDQIPEIYINRGNLWFSTGRYADAVDAYTTALELDMRDPQIGYLNRGFAHERGGNLARALEDYSHALELAPGWNFVEQKVEAIQQRIAEAASEESGS